MKKKLVIVLSVVALVLALLIAGALSFLYYQNNHFIVEGSTYFRGSETLDLREQDISFGHYEAVKSQLPDCEILWNVPFQGGRFSSDSKTLAVKSLTQEDVQLLLTYFPELNVLDASQCQDYLSLELLKAQKPECEVRYEVSLGGRSYGPDTTELVLENGDYDFVTMMANLVYLPDVTAIQLKMPELTREQVDELRSAYEDIDISCTVELLGQEYDNTVTRLDLSDMTSEDVQEVAEKLFLLPDVASVELTREDGTSALTMEEVKTLKAAAPQASFHYVFDFYGVKLSTTDETVHISTKKIGAEGIDNVRLALDLMENCQRFVLEYCSIPNDLLAQVRDEYRDKTKVVWRVFFGQGSTMTDAEVIRAVYNLNDRNCQDLIYCEDARYIDIGHNETLNEVPFVAGMPNLELIIISGAPVKSLEPFRSCKKLRILEAAFCEYITDIGPLADCDSLEMVNIANSHVVDLSPLDDKNLIRFVAMHDPSGKSRVPLEEQQRFLEQHPDCQTAFQGTQPYGKVWRYNEEGKYDDWYLELRRQFKLDDATIPNHVGWAFAE